MTIPAGEAPLPNVNAMEWPAGTARNGRDGQVAKPKVDTVDEHGGEGHMADPRAGNVAAHQGQAQPSAGTEPIDDRVFCVRPEGMIGECRSLHAANGFVIGG